MLLVLYPPAEYHATDALLPQVLCHPLLVLKVDLVLVLQCDLVLKLVLGKMTVCNVVELRLCLQALHLRRIEAICIDTLSSDPFGDRQGANILLLVLLVLLSELLFGLVRDNLLLMSNRHVEAWLSWLVRLSHGQCIRYRLRGHLDGGTWLLPREGLPALVLVVGGG